MSLRWPVYPSAFRRESIFWTLKGQLSPERHGARTLHNLRACIAQRRLTLTAAITLNHQLGRPTRALANYCASKPVESAIQIQPRLVALGRSPIPGSPRSPRPPRRF